MVRAVWDGGVSLFTELFENYSKVVQMIWKNLFNFLIGEEKNCLILIYNKIKTVFWIIFFKNEY
jgi:hypothetical protein